MSEQPRFIAKQPIFIGRARAHNPGDVVPARNVEKHGWHDLVTREGSAEAENVPGVYDPSTDNVDGVIGYLEAADDDEIDRVLAAEAAGKNRSSIMSFRS